MLAPASSGAFLLPVALLTAVASAATTTTQTCYYPDGVTVADGDVPCNSTAANSACCYKNNLCLDNGLCLLDGVMSRGSCTDKNWGDSCANFCKDGYGNGGMSLFPCSGTGGVFSCSWGKCTETFAINGGNAVVLRPSQVAALGIKAALEVDATDLLQVEGRPDLNFSSTATTYSAREMAAVGAGIGGPLLLALLGALFLLVRERRAGRIRELSQRPVEKDSQPILQQYSPQPVQSVATGLGLTAPLVSQAQAYQSSGTCSSGYGETSAARVRELDGDMMKRELDGSRDLQELPTSEKG